MKRTAAVAFTSVVAVLIGLGAAAYACTSLATLNLSKPTGGAGETLTVTATSFKIGTAAEPAPPVAFHWNAMDGPVLAQGATDAAGNVTATFAVPADAAPGNYVVIARQIDAEGKDHWGTPARAAFQVTAAGSEPVAVQTAGSRPFSTATSGSSGAVGLALGLGALGVVLFGAGFMAVVRQTRRQPVPVPAPSGTPKD